MAEFDSSIAGEVVAACQAGAAEAAGALSRTLDAAIELVVGDSAAFDPAAHAAELSGPGLAILQFVGTAGAVALIAENSGLLPDWYAQPDATGTSKLATLAQELGMLLLPEQFMPDDFRAARVPHLGEALERAGIGSASFVPLAMNAGDKQATLYLVWPLAQPKELFNVPPEAAPAPKVEEKPAAKVEEKPAPKPAPTAAAAPPPPKPAAKPALGYEHLPAYTRSLLRIPVPVIVTLAKKKQPLKKITELRPGAIIQFDKSCEEMLELEVNGQIAAEGECVKAGDKFGLRITAMRPPDERFRTVRRER